MDSSDAITVLNHYIDLCQLVDDEIRQNRAGQVAQAAARHRVLASRDPGELFQSWQSPTKDDLHSLEPLVERIVHEVDPKRAVQLPLCADAQQRKKIALGARTLMAYGPAPVNDELASLHPVVSEAAREQWTAKHHREAVSNAAQAVNGHLQTKFQRRDLDGSSLIREAFGQGDGVRLRFPRLPSYSTDTWKNRHNGARDFGVGLFTGIRNVVAHADPRDPTSRLDPGVALDCLHAWSLMARWIDEADLLVKADAL